MNIESAEDLLLSTKKVLDSLKTPFWLHYGTLLVAVRDGKFKPDDNDLDAMVRDSDWDDPMFTDFAASGLRCFRTREFQGRTAAMCITKDNHLRIDVNVLFHDPVSKTYFVPQHIRGNFGLGTFHHVLPKGYLDRENHVDFLGTQFRIPWNVEGFLADIYGDWKTELGYAEWKRRLKENDAALCKHR